MKPSRGFLAPYPSHLASETALLLHAGHRFRIVRYSNRRLSACLVSPRGPLRGREDPHHGASSRGALESDVQLPISHRPTRSLDDLLDACVAFLGSVLDRTAELASMTPLERLDDERKFLDSLGAALAARARVAK